MHLIGGTEEYHEKPESELHLARRKSHCRKYELVLNLALNYYLFTVLAVKGSGRRVKI
jgi:hypothetical protein